MRHFFLSLVALLPLIAEDNSHSIFHKTVGQIETYKDKSTMQLKTGCVRRLTKNLLTPIHKRKSYSNREVESHIVSKSKDGPVTIKFLLPISLKKEVIKLLARNKLTLSIPFSDSNVITTKKIEIDRLANPPKGLFALKSRIESSLLSPSEVIFIHLLKENLNSGRL